MKSFPVLLSSMLSDRKLSRWIVAALGLQLVSLSLPFSIWPCPIFHVTGIPCPGCGLSRATELLLTGDWQGAMRYHGFAPVLLVIVILFALAAFLPDRLHQRLTGLIDCIERKTAFAYVGLTVFMLYWLGRLLLSPTDFIHLIQGI